MNIDGEINLYSNENLKNCWCFINLKIGVLNYSSLYFLFCIKNQFLFLESHAKFLYLKIKNMRIEFLFQNIQLNFYLKSLQNWSGSEILLILLRLLLYKIILLDVKFVVLKAIEIFILYLKQQTSHEILFALHEQPRTIMNWPGTNSEIVRGTQNDRI